MVSRPDDRQEPADPHSLDRADLERFPGADYRTIALHRLGGLADVGALRPIVPKPKDTGDMVRDVAVYVAWRARFSIDDDDWDQNQPPLSVRAFAPDVAEQMLGDVETWARGEAAERGEALTTSGPNLPPELVAKLDSAAAKVVQAMTARDDDDTPALPAVTDAIDEHDAAILAFLNRAPSLRRKVSDVLPEEGPQDRKAVAARLRKLADRTPPLVDYPKGGRGGVAILTAGVEALKRATPPTPR